MRVRLVFVVLACILVLAGYSFARSDRVGCADQPHIGDVRRPLSVVLYPFIPNFKEVLYTIKSGFEEMHPDVELCFVDLSANYYAKTKHGQPAKAYIGTAEADIYELDSVFLQDFIDNEKIQELPRSAQLPVDQLLRNALDGSSIGGKRYGAPHWVCGNFVFFRAGDAAMRNVHTFADLETTVGGSDHAVGTGLLVDLKGSSTLGEFYLEAATDKYGWPDASSHLRTVENPLEDKLTRLSHLCDEGYCRDDDYHGKEIYGRAFSRNKGRILVGYSETLHAVLAETQQGCVKNDRCLTDADIDVVQLSLDDKGSHQISWVDSFVIAKGCSSACLADAVAFIQYMNQDATYVSILQPSPDVPPAYLLPAKATLFTNREVTGPAHLYPKLREIIEAAAAPSGSGLNDMLRNDGATIDAAFPVK